MIGLISNPNSGHNRDQFRRLSGLLDAQPNIIHCITESSQQIPAALEQLRQQPIEALAINGGDGTLSATLGHALENRIFGKLPPVVVLPGGTANMSAGDVGVRGTLAAAVSRLCAWSNGEAPESQRIQRVMMRVCVEPDSRPHYGMFLGAGAVIQGTEYAHRELHSRGLRDDFSVALGALRTLWGVVRREGQCRRAVDVNLHLQERSGWDRHRTLILAVSSLHRLFMGIDPFWGEGPGALRISVIENDCRRFLLSFPSIARGRPNRLARPENGYFSYNTDHITLQIDAAFNLDGEILYGSDADGTVTISASKPITFLRL